MTALGLGVLQEMTRHGIGVPDEVVVQPQLDICRSGLPMAR